MITQTVIQELVRTTGLLSKDMNKNSVSRSIVEQAQDVTKSDIAALYIFREEQNKYPLLHKRGRFEIPTGLLASAETPEFLVESCETVVLANRDSKFFQDMLLHPEMNSGIAAPLFNQHRFSGFLVVNSRHPRHYGQDRFSFMDSFSRMASGLLSNIDLFQELKDRLREIEGLERYQNNVFTSMNNLLLTLDESGKIHYFNASAAESLGLSETDIEADFSSRFKGKLDKRVFKQIQKVSESGKPMAGLEGIFQDGEREMDYSMNIAPLLGSRGKHEGLTLILSNQTKERQLKNQVDLAVEDRRVVKDMFSRYLSEDIVHQLMLNPANVRLGGEKKDATIFFADICGYTSFSEGKDPQYIVEVLNEFFSVSLEVVIKFGGYIDKLIGDCIMAAFGVPMGKGEADAINAVSCAVEIQDLVRDKNRSFFKGQAEHLRLSIGMNSGPVVVGNLGSTRRMDYSVISDTVNVAARLEGVATADDIIISAATRDIIGDRFRLKELPPVKVKGKEKPISIFNVLGIRA